MLDLTREKPIKIADVAKWLGVKPEVVKAWLSCGLEHAKIGSVVFTSREAVERFCGPAPVKEVVEEPKPPDSPMGGARASWAESLADACPRGRIKFRAAVAAGLARGKNGDAALFAKRAASPFSQLPATGGLGSSRPMVKSASARPTFSRKSSYVYSKSSGRGPSGRLGQP